MATIAYQAITTAGVGPTFVAAAAGGDKVAPNERGFVYVKNGGASAVTVTVAVPGTTKYGQANPSFSVSVPASGERALGPFPWDLGQPSDGLVALSYSAVTSVTIAALTL